jgi:hypothetical protein
MKKSQKASLLLYFSALTLLAVVAFFSAAQNASAQELVRGTITLSVTARLGDTDLPPGVYRFSVLSLNTINSVESIQVGNSRVMVTLNAINNDAHAVSLLATASKSVASNSQLPSSLKFGAANAIRSISLTNLGLTIDFTGKQAGEVVRSAQMNERSALHSSAKGHD